MGGTCCNCIDVSIDRCDNVDCLHSGQGSNKIGKQLNLSKPTVLNSKSWFTFLFFIELATQLRLLKWSMNTSKTTFKMRINTINLFICLLDEQAISSHLGTMEKHVCLCMSVYERLLQPNIFPLDSYVRERIPLFAQNEMK